MEKVVTLDVELLLLTMMVKNKNKTIIGNNSFIGCNTNLISPVTVEDNTYIAAGSTITNNVKSGELAVARAKQRNIEGWVDKKGLIKKK